MPRETTPHRFSSSEDRQHVFESIPAPRSQEDEFESWVDLYALLNVPPSTPAGELDEVIIERGADIVYFTFSRAGKPSQVKKLEAHLHEMRPILLDAPTRRRYDQQLKLHRAGDPRAQKYEDFLKGLDLREQAQGCLAIAAFFFIPVMATVICNFS